MIYPCHETGLLKVSKGQGTRRQAILVGPTVIAIEMLEPTVPMSLKNQELD